MSTEIIKIKVDNPLTNTASLGISNNEDERDSTIGRKASQAYLESKRNNTRESIDLERKGKGPNDYEYRDQDDETLDVNLPADFHNSTNITFYQKIRRIGRKTTCMALCLLSFGLAMIITSFVFASRVSNDGFYLFLLIGVCSIIPGSYASYHVLGRFFGWLFYYFLRFFLTLL